MPIPHVIARLNRYVANPVLGRVARLAPGFGVVHHVGRMSGRDYSVPVNVFRDGNRLAIAMTYSSNSDWVKNVGATDSCVIEMRGNLAPFIDPVIVVDREKRWAPWPVRRFLGLIGSTR